MTRSKARYPALTRIAYHEAGHAVPAQIVDRHLRSVAIIPNEKRGSLEPATFHRLGAGFQPDMEVSS
jgi:ATP-dependent Zn protease